MRVLLTGATGFLGRHLHPALAAAGHEVVGLGSRDGDLTDPQTLDRAANGAFERVVHLAAWTQAGDFCLHHPGEQWLVNQRLNTNVLEWWHRRQPQARLVAMGTSCAYDPNLPLREEHYLDGRPIDSLFTYAMTKRMLYAGLLALHRQFGHAYFHAVPSTLYGPDYHTDGRQLHFVFDLIRKILRGKHRGEPVVLWGDGEQKREVVHVRDFTADLLDLSERCPNESVNLGAGEEHSIREFATLICEQVGFDPADIRYDTDRYVGARSKCLDVSRLDALRPGRHRTPLRDGLADTIAWFHDQPEQA